jgi:hypothetical protein
MTTINENAVLLSKNVKEITFEPFCVFQKENFLPENIYQELYRSFPERTWFAEGNEYGKNAFNSTANPGRFLEFCNSAPAWKELYRCISSDRSE